MVQKPWVMGLAFTVVQLVLDLCQECSVINIRLCSSTALSCNGPLSLLGTKLRRTLRPFSRYLNNNGSNALLFNVVPVIDSTLSTIVTLEMDGNTIQ